MWMGHGWIWENEMAIDGEMNNCRRVAQRWNRTKWMMGLSFSPLLDYGGDVGQTGGGEVSDWLPMSLVCWAGCRLGGKEISEAACWLALHRRVQGTWFDAAFAFDATTFGERKVMHHTRMMELTVGTGRYQIEMVLKRKSDCEAMSDEIDDAMECMVAWMRKTHIWDKCNNSTWKIGEMKMFDFVSRYNSRPKVFFHKGSDEQGDEITCGCEEL